MKNGKIKLIYLVLGVVLIVAVITAIFIVVLGSQNKEMNENNQTLSQEGQNKENIGNANQNQVQTQTQREFTKNMLQDEMFDITNPIPVEIDGKYGYIDTTGKIIIQPKFDFAYDFVGNYAVVTIKDENSSTKIQSIIDRNGNIVKDGNNTKNIDFDNREYGSYKIDGELYNLELEKISPDGMQVKGSLEKGYYEYFYNNEYGIINSLGEIVYSSETSIISTILENRENNIYAHIEIYGKSILEDKRQVIVDLQTGKVLCELEQNEDSSKALGTQLYVTIDTSNGDYKNYKRLLAIKDGEVLLNLKQDNIESAYWYDGAMDIVCIKYKEKEDAIYYSMSQKQYVNVSEKTIFNGSDFYPENIIFENYIINGTAEKHGITDKNGNEIIPQDYVNISINTEEMVEYVLKKYNKIYIGAGNTEKLDLYEIVSNQKVASDAHQGKCIIEKSIFTGLSYHSTWGYTTGLVTSIVNVTNGKGVKVNSSNVVFGPTYFYMKEGNKKIYYNSEFQKIYEATN